MKRKYKIIAPLKTWAGCLSECFAKGLGIKKGKPAERLAEAVALRPDLYQSAEQLKAAGYEWIDQRGTYNWRTGRSEGYRVGWFHPSGQDPLALGQNAISEKIEKAA